MADKKEAVAAHLTEHGHTWTIGLAIALVVLYFSVGKFSSNSADEFIGKCALFLVSAVGFPSGCLALLFMACMKSSEFGKLEKFQFYLILGFGLSTLAAAVVLLQAFGLVTIPLAPPAKV